MSQFLLGRKELIENPTTRIPVCLCLDVSGSMHGAPMQELNRGVQLFFDAIREDEIAQWSAEISIVTFGENVQNIVDFGSIHRQEVPFLTANGATPMGEAVNLALDLLDSRKKEYAKVGIDYFQPWLILMTDGYPNGSQASLQMAIERTQALVANRKLTLFPISIGGQSDIKVLNAFSGNRGAFNLNSMNFREFFTWLSKSVQETSVSTPGEEPDLFEEVMKLKQPWLSKEV